MTRNRENKPQSAGTSVRVRRNTVHSTAKANGAVLAASPHLASTIGLSGFLNTHPGKLTLDERKTIVGQALALLENTYVHLPQKRTMYAVNPVQRLRLLSYRLEQTPVDKLPSELDFHREMLDIFMSVRDLHTNYQLPSPFAEHTAYLPFLIEEFVEDRQRKYIVSKWINGFSHPTFRKGSEVLYWNGVPIARAIELNGDLQAGSNSDARYARGLESLTIRPLSASFPPDEEWVTIDYRSLEGERLQLQQPWLVFVPDLGEKGVDGSDDARARAPVANSLNYKSYAIQQARELFFAAEAVEAAQKIARAEVDRAAPPNGMPTTLPTVLSARMLDTPRGQFGYIRLYTFMVDDQRFISEMIRLVHALPQNGLILDVRGNGGGSIYASERLLQLFTPRPIKPQPAQFINTALMLSLCRLHNDPDDPDGLDLSPWVKSVAQATETGAIHSLGHPITPEELCNDVGQQYYGPVVLITDALCYSATDIFSAGFKDHEIGVILGASGNTGAGGANVWTHSLLRRFLRSGPDSPFGILPEGCDMRVAIRRTLRVGEQAGVPVEDFGIEPDYRHDMTRNDLLHDNMDLLNHAAEILAAMPVRELTVTVGARTRQKLTLATRTKGIDRLDVLLDGRTHKTLDTADVAIRIDLQLPAQGARHLEIRGHSGNVLVAVRHLDLESA